ncbi:MAG: UDP-N-acetylmuramate dehydrogenase [Candidatus Omnitrophica bacterium]|nr:UDP-N-acetylmuramate dehydrogenase [Candidatus Omnitrophota bacterium]
MNIAAGKNIKQKLEEGFKGKIKPQEVLAKYTSIKIGGPVDLFLLPENCDDLIFLIKFLNSRGIRFRVIGNGTNLLISEQKLHGAVVQLCSEYFKTIKEEGNVVLAGAGILLPAFIEFARVKGFSGCEFLSGIPGTIGGALIMNAGVKDLDYKSNGKTYCISDILKKVEVVDKEGNKRVFSKAEISFFYRGSDLKDKGTVVRAWFNLQKENTDKVSVNIKRYWQHRRLFQDISLPNAGCVFKNPQNYSLSAGELIDRCRLKGTSVGDAKVSTVHANFIVNADKARFDQVKELISLIQRNNRYEYK